MKVVCGIDAGQSSTRALILDETGQVLGNGRSGGVIHTSSAGGVARFVDAVLGALDAALADADRPHAVPAALVIGASGIESADAREAIETRTAVTHALAARSALRPVIIQVTSDAHTALYGAHAGGPGIIAVAGTGSIVLGRDAQGHEVRIGGWGWLVDDAGSAFAIGRDGLRAAVRAADGTGPPTALTEAMRSALDVTELFALKRRHLLQKANPMPTTLPLLIIADDLTGAADSAARCRQAGLSAAIAVMPPVLPLPTGALAIQTDSRHLSPDAARRAVMQICAPLVGRPATWYKKIDSTLRGNLGAELDALLELSGAPCAAICPAFPAQSRGLENGFLVHADTPPGTVHLPTLLAAQSRRAVAAIDLAAVRAGVAELGRAVQEARRSGAELLAVDGLTDADLHTIIAAVQQAAPAALFCGSAGLVGALAHERVPRAGPSIQAAPDRPAANSILFVVGSGSVMARRQIEALTARCAPRRSAAANVIAWSYRSDTGHEAGHDAAVTLLHLPPPPPAARLDGPDARRLAAQLAGAAMAHIQSDRPAALVLVGGDTAVALLTQLGVTRLNVITELLPGMPLTLAEPSGCPSLHVVLKAGNHGDSETLLDLWRLLTIKA